MQRQLLRFEPFCDWGPSALAVVAAGSRYLDVPAGRWLLRRGRQLRGRHYLLRGALRARAPDAVIRAGDPRARQPIAPGPEALCTLTDCRLLQVEDAAMELASAHPDASLIRVEEAAGCWQARFVASQLMMDFRPAIWQRVLGRLSPRTHGAGDWVLRQGDPQADHCCILARGEAEVLQNGRRLALLGPGDLFGEDALMAGEPRNASVRMLCAGEVMSMPVIEFTRLLGDVLSAVALPPTDKRQTEARTVLIVSSPRNLRARFARLDRQQGYFVAGRSQALEVLALFLLRKMGIAAWPAPRG